LPPAPEHLVEPPAHVASVQSTFDRWILKWPS
jgi:hypothetical protein